MNKEKLHVLEWDTGQGATHTVFARELRGDSGGPTLALVGGEHGIELTGPAGIDLACRELAGRRFRGTVLAVPTISPPNIRYRNHTFGQPHGKGYTGEMPYNTWIKWPGRPDGDPAERLCHLVWNEVVSRADVLLNFHTWSGNSASCFFTSESVAPMGQVARHFGVPFVEPADTHEARTLHGRLLSLGKPAGLIELQGQWQIPVTMLQRVRQGILNTMGVLGMLDDAPLALPGPFFPMDGKEYLVKAPCGGLFVPLKGVEQPVREGELLGYLLDPESGARTDIRSPVPGATWLVARTGPAADVQLTGLHAYADAGDLLALIKGVRP